MADASEDMHSIAIDMTPVLQTAPSIAKEGFRTLSLKLNDSAAALTWQNLSIETVVGRKKILKGVSGTIDGGFWAVMGPSGSGKSTLLNALACRLDRYQRMKGEVRLNGRKYTHTELKKMSGYVMQDDLLHAHLTVEETLGYTAELRLPPTIKEEERKARVRSVMQQMGLEHCRGTVIGDPMVKGISGGERKRVCVAMELLTKPYLLFCDEPTSGLDSVTALGLCSKLKSLADSGTCTVVCTIHQPQSKIFAMFDNLILLKSGDIVYQGAAKAAIHTFAKSGFPCPTHTNPAEHLLDIITPAIHESREALGDNDLKIKANWAPPQVDLTFGQDKPFMLDREITPWLTQFVVLLRRSFKEMFRKRLLLLTQLIQAVVMAVLIGTAFLKIGTTQSSIVRREPVLFFCVINQGVFASLAVINNFPSERMLVLRERAAGTYYVSAYFLAKITIETVMGLLAPILFSCVVYFLIGLQAHAAKFFIFMGFMILCSLAATSLALMISAICRTTDMSVTVLPLALEMGRLFGGFFLAPVNLPKYFSWLDALSYVKYTYTGISLNELQGLQLHCTPSQLQAAGGVCPITNGEQTMVALGLDYLTMAQCAGILISYIVIARVFAFLGLRYIKW